MPELNRLAHKIAQHLAGSCQSLQSALEQFDADGADNEMVFCNELDRLVFECVDCGWWHTQAENASRDGQWRCHECAREDETDEI